MRLKEKHKLEGKTPASRVAPYWLTHLYHAMRRDESCLISMLLDMTMKFLAQYSVQPVITRIRNQSQRLITQNYLHPQ